MDVQDLMKKATIFHGHICPGVALGVLVAKYILSLGFEHSPDEELVAVVENDNCSVDALQVLLGTTFGKGNLIHQDYGKNNYCFYDRRTEKSVRLALKSGKIGNKKQSRDEKIQFLLKSKPEDIFNIYEIEFNPPGLARIEESVPCEICGELVMNSRVLTYNNSEMCISCYRKMREK